MFWEFVHAGKSSAHKSKRVCHGALFYLKFRVSGHDTFLVVWSYPIAILLTKVELK